MKSLKDKNKKHTEVDNKHQSQKDDNQDSVKEEKSINIVEQKIKQLEQEKQTTEGSNTISHHTKEIIHKEKTVEESSNNNKKEEENEVIIEEVPIKEVKVEEIGSLFTRSIVPIIIGIVVGILTAVSIILYYNSKTGNIFQSSEEILTPTPSAAISQTPLSEKESTSSAELMVRDLTLYDIQVLNGSGKGGEAGKLEKALKEKGFSVLEIGNADNSNYEKTIIEVKKDVSEDYVKKLKEFVATRLLVGETKMLSESSDVDIIITVGRNEATTSATPTP